MANNPQIIRDTPSYLEHSIPITHTFQTHTHKKRKEVLTYLTESSYVRATDIFRAALHNHSLCLFTLNLLYLLSIFTFWKWGWISALF